MLFLQKIEVQYLVYSIVFLYQIVSINILIVIFYIFYYIIFLQQHTRLLEISPTFQ
jgi:hypothetical protein